MTDTQVHARLVNAGGELIAEGSCWLNEAVGQATLEPDREPGLLEKERGELTLELETGRSLRVSDKPLIFRMRPRGTGADHSSRRRMYRLWLIRQPETSANSIETLTEHAQEANAAGAAEEGTSAVSVEMRRPPALRQGETPAAS